MTDIPIIFSAPMIRALLAGRKTMTRRLATSPLRKVHPGDRLWVRESLFKHDFLGWRYSADNTAVTLDQDHPGVPAMRSWALRKEGWSAPSIHMPRWASRLTLIVTGLKVERLQDISREDAIAEGCTPRSNCNGFQDRYEGWSMDWSEVGKFSRFATGGPGLLRERDVSIGDPRFAFASFLNHLHNGENWNLPGKPTPIWDENPFVAAISFRVIKANIDAPEALAA